MKTTTRFFASTITVFAFGFALGQVFDGGTAANAQGSKVFELRTYTAPEGKLPNLLARFSDHTLRIFEKHGMVNVGYWVPQDTPASANTLIYILSHDSRAAAERSWAASREDAEWQRIAEESQVDGRIVSSVESVFMNAADFSPMQ
jgi:hypothetical protein